MLRFAGAALAQHVFDEVQALAVQACGERILFSTGFGSTETAPFALARTWPTANATNMGLPGAGLELKLVPNEGKLEARVRGPNITPGYWRQPDYTAAAFDEEGFYKLGDCFKFADPNDPKHGLLFDGRIAENFKLATGTWVHVGPLRAQFVDAFAPYVRDVVIAGEGCDDVAASGVSEYRRLPRSMWRSCRPRRARGRRWRCPRAGALYDAARKDGTPQHRLVDQNLPRAADGRAALPRQGGDDRQGFDQPARRPEKPRGSG